MRRLTDPADLAPILNRDWPWAGFALGDLEPEMMPYCEWRQAAQTIVLLFKRLDPPLLFHFGDASGLDELLPSLDLPRIWANLLPEHESAFRRFYRPENCVRMCRMFLDRPVTPIGNATPLTLADQPEIEALLADGEWVLLIPERLATGHYYGVRENGRLVALAGTHLASVRYNIAALGTVFTHRDYRGRGLAQVCCSHALASFARVGIRRVILNVEESKAGARRVYERLGFQTACTYLDGTCVRI